MSEPDVRVGDIWADNDPRILQGYRLVRVLALEGADGVGSNGIAVCEAWWENGHDSLSVPRKTRIRVNRFRPNRTGYRLVERMGSTPSSRGSRA